MLATGGSACTAIEVIKARGVPEENIIFVNVLASQRGIQTVFSRFPSIRLVTAAVDEELTPRRLVVMKSPRSLKDANCGQSYRSRLR